MSRGGTSGRRAGGVERGCGRDLEVGAEAVAFDGLAAWKGEAGDGGIMSAGLEEAREERLRGALAMGALADDDGAPVGLEGAGEDLGGGGGEAVDEEEERECIGSVAAGAIDGLVAVAVRGRDDDGVSGRKSPASSTAERSSPRDSRADRGSTP